MAVGVQDLWELSKRVGDEVRRLESICERQQDMHQSALRELDDNLGDAFGSLQLLGDGIHTVSGKIVHVGEELEAVNLRKTQAEAAIELSRHFEAFDSADGDVLPPFYDLIETSTYGTGPAVLSTHDLHKAADIIQVRRPMRHAGK